MRGSTSRLIIDIYGGSGLQRLYTVPLSLLISATYRASLDAASTFTIEVPAEPELKPYISTGIQLVVNEIVHDALKTPEKRTDFVGRFVIESVETAFAEDGTEVMRATAKSRLCYEAERAGTYGETNFAPLGEAISARHHICLAQAAMRLERDITMQVHLSSVQTFSPGRFALSSSDSVMAHLSSLADSMGMHWRVFDGVDSPFIEMFDIPPIAPGYMPVRPSIFIRSPQAVPTTMASPEPADFYWSALSKLVDRSNAYGGIFVEGGSWRSSDTSDAILTPAGTTLPAPFAVTEIARPDGRPAYFVSNTPAGANRLRGSILVRFSGISPVSADGVAPSNPVIAEAAQALAEAAMRTLQYNLTAADIYNMTIPGPILWCIRAGDRISGFFDSPRDQLQSQITLYVMSISTVWQDESVLSTIEASTAMVSARDYRRTQFGEDFSRSRGIRENPVIAAPIYSFATVVCNPSGTYIFPVPYLTPPVVGIWTAPASCLPYVASVTNTQVTIVNQGALCLGPQNIDIFIV